MPEAQFTPEHSDLVKTFQIQHHSKTCRRYKNEKCCFHFSCYFIDHTIIARPLQATLSCAKKKEILSESELSELPYLVLKVLPEYMNDQLNPSKHNIYDYTREDYEQVKSIEEILEFHHITVDEYYYYLANLHQPPNSCFVNNYCKIGWSAWQANMDIQSVFNEHEANAYVRAYLRKSEESCSNAKKQALKISNEISTAQAYASN